MNLEKNDAPVCVITGGTSGIGRASVQEFFENGYRIATCGRDTDRVARLRSGLLVDASSHYVAEVDLAVLAKFGSGERHHIERPDRRIGLNK